ncbi:hypothetical protein UPYG_G00044840 [Umbra pygmaea]|uniref:Uncharacterized protein n=1 Tax=Umbra pygmaea TaxID=75934 RepID=A0ABD0Y4B7_UMBPY
MKRKMSVTGENMLPNFSKRKAQQMQLQATALSVHPHTPEPALLPTEEASLPPRRPSPAAAPWTRHSTAPSVGPAPAHVPSPRPGSCHSAREAPARRTAARHLQSAGSCH